MGKKKTRRLSETARNKRLRNNYRLLLRAGFSASEAHKHRNMSDASIKRIIAQKTKKSKQKMMTNEKSNRDLYNARRREIYKKLRELGYSSKEASRLSSLSSKEINNLVSRKIKKVKNDLINSKRRENYRKLIEAGYSSKEASKHRKMSDENIEKLIAIKKLNLPKEYVDILSKWDHKIIDFLLSHQEFLSAEELKEKIDLSNDGEGVDLISFIDRIKNLLEKKGLDFTPIENDWFEGILEVYGYV